MSLNRKLIGRPLEPLTFSYDEDRVILYALGVGAGVDELEYVYEKGLKVLPGFAVVPVMPNIFQLIQAAGINLKGALHTGHKITLYGPIPLSGTVTTTGTMLEVYDQGDKGALIQASFETRDEDGGLLFKNFYAVLDRTAGNFGGAPIPKSEMMLPPQGVAPDFSMAHTSSADQCAIYRLSGDKNPLHIDPEFARQARLDKPILMGLCTFGFAIRAIVNSVCHGEPFCLKSFSCRFTGIVYPGDQLITEGWRHENGRYMIQTKTGDGKIVLANALAEID
ncbi:MAG: MaoC family dehydratase N-terminal domain-containing protein [Deltaproteobacteria bacterium]|nr:MaoC family dehydratase N-terminal domain-containing protein [Deltaproteobacteria bacterium]